MARLVAPVVGAVVGFAIGGPVGAQVGWAAGSLAVALLFPETIRNVQPRLDDLKVTTGAYGQPIPYVEGSMRVGGWVAWASDRRPIDTTTTVDSKGGPKVENTTTTYEVDMLIVLASHRIAGVRRIWADGELVWSRAAESDFATISASSTFARRVTVYTGDENQLPDPTYEAAVGVGNAPAYRERGSIFLEGLDLGQSGRIPNLTFEVCTVTDFAVSTQEIGAIQNSPSYIQNSTGSPEYRGAETRFMSAPWASGNSSEAFRIYEIEDDGEIRVDGSVPLPFYSSVLGVAQGQSDEMLAVMTGESTLPTGLMQIVRPNGGLVSLDTEIPNYNGRDNIIYAIRAGVTYLGARVTPWDRRIRRYSSAGGLPTAVSVELDPDEGLRSIAIDQSGSVFVLGQTGGGIVPRQITRLHPETLSVEETFESPAIFQGAELFTDDVGRLHLLDLNSVYRWSGGSQWVEVLSGIPTGYGSAIQEAGPLVFPDYRAGVLKTVRRLDDGRVVVRAAWPSISLPAVPLTTALHRLHERAGMSLTDVDVSALAGKTTRGFAVTQISTTRTAIEALMAAHFFQAVKDNGIRYVNRGGAPVATIPYDDLGAAEAGAESPEPLEITEANDIEIPAFVAVKYANISDDYQEGLEYSDRLITESTETRVVEFAMAMTPTEARQLAQKIANDLQVSKARVSALSLQRKYAALQPTDVVMVQGRDGLTVRVRLDKRDEADGVIKLEGVLDDASVVTGTATTDTDYGGSFSITLPSRTNWAELDIPLLRTADDGPSFEVAFGAAGSNWRGAVYFAGDDDTALQQITAVSTETVTGSCLTALGVWSGGGGVQVTGFLDVQVDGELSSITYDQLMAGGNTAAISSSGRWEIIGFQYAELLSTSGSSRTYRLRNFVRYRRGTEGVVHAIGDRFVLMQTQGIRRIPMSLADLQRQRRYKAVSSGRSIDSAQSVAFSWTGEKLKPLSPSNVRGNRDAADLVITWARRTRHEDNWLLGSVPLGETTERYEVDILNGSTVVRTLSSTTQSVTYTAAQQTTDFGSPPASVSVRVYQLSDSIGRGYPAAATV